jgi:hypothetical protein
VQQQLKQKKSDNEASRSNAGSTMQQSSYPNSSAQYGGTAPRHFNMSSNYSSAPQSAMYPPQMSSQQQPQQQQQLMMQAGSQMPPNASFDRQYSTQQQGISYYPPQASGQQQYQQYDSSNKNGMSG